MNLVRKILVSALLIGASAVGGGAGTALAQSSDIDCKSEVGFCVVTDTGLPLRLLTKPQSSIYSEMDDQSTIVEANLPEFSVVIAFDSIEVNYDENHFAVQGWFRVGPTPEKPTGFMKASDVVEWKQALSLTYTNPGVTLRREVLMFSDLDALETTIKGIDDGSIEAISIYDAIEAGDVPDDIVSKERKDFVNLFNEGQFYLLPILDSKDISGYRADGGNMKALQIAAVTQEPRGAAGDACDLHQTESKDCDKRTSDEAAKDRRLDVVFVIDMTSSMQPHIDAVSNAVRFASQTLTESMKDSERLKFGLVGYRDNVAITPELEFVTKNFTPDLVGGDEFGGIIDSVRAADSGSDDWPEEVFAGVQEGLDSNWSPDTPRVIVLIGDASAHEPDHPSSTTRQTEESLRALADENKVFISSIYIGNPESPDAVEARPQFQALARNSAGDGDTAAFAVVSGGAAATELEWQLQQVVDGIIKFVDSGDITSIASGDLAKIGEGGGAGSAIASAVRAAFVDYIGKDASPPNNVVAWVSDHDLINFSTQSFEVRVLVQRDDLQDLLKLLDTLMGAYRSGTKTTGGFFGGLQGGSVATSLDLGIAETEPFRETEVVPRWIKALPYVSSVLSKTIEEFRNMSPNDKTEFESRIERLKDLYDDLLNRTDGWISLNQQARIGDQIYMLRLADLP